MNKKNAEEIALSLNIIDDTLFQNGKMEVASIK